MNYSIKNKHLTTKWSGGETTELCIFPEDADYKKGNYQFRISTATVEIETSTFSALPGVDRTLMVLDGKMQLNHEGHHSSTLSPMETDEFKGDWTTHSIGTCVDFNLMCKSGAKGKVKGYHLNANKNLNLNLKGSKHFLYIYKGTLEIDNKQINTGDFVLLNEEADQINILALAACSIAFVEIES